MQQLNELESVANLAGEPRHISAAGVTRTGQRLITLENASPFEPSQDARRRIVVVADNDRAALATLAAIRWFKTAAPRNVRDQWAISAVLLSHGNDATPAQQLEFPPVKGFFDHPEQPESRYLWRWVAYQAPDRRVAGPRRGRPFTQHAAHGFSGVSNGGRLGNWYCAGCLWIGARGRRPGAASERSERRGRHADLGNPFYAEGACVARAVGDRPCPRREVSADSSCQLHSVGGVGQYASSCGHHER